MLPSLDDELAEGENVVLVVGETVDDDGGEDMGGPTKGSNAALQLPSSVINAESASRSAVLPVRPDPAAPRVARAVDATNIDDNIDNDHHNIRPYNFMILPKILVFVVFVKNSISPFCTSVSHPRQ